MFSSTRSGGTCTNKFSRTIIHDFKHKAILTKTASKILASFITSCHCYFSDSSFIDIECDWILLDQDRQLQRQTGRYSCLFYIWFRWGISEKMCKRRRLLRSGDVWRIIQSTISGSTVGTTGQYSVHYCILEHVFSCMTTRLRHFSSHSYFTYKSLSYVKLIDLLFFATSAKTFAKFLKVCTMVVLNLYTGAVPQFADAQQFSQHHRLCGRAGDFIGRRWFERERLLHQPNGHRTQGTAPRLSYISTSLLQQILYVFMNTIIARHRRYGRWDAYHNVTSFVCSAR